MVLLRRHTSVWCHDDPEQRVQSMNRRWPSRWIFVLVRWILPVIGHFSQRSRDRTTLNKDLEASWLFKWRRNTLKWPIIKSLLINVINLNPQRTSIPWRECRKTPRMIRIREDYRGWRVSGRFTRAVVGGSRLSGVVCWFLYVGWPCARCDDDYFAPALSGRRNQ